MSIEFKFGDTVKFKPGPKWTGGPVTAKVTAIYGPFLFTEDASGKVRRMRKGACKPADASARKRRV